MHYLQLVDSIVLLFSSPLTIHKFHPYYHRLKAITSLEEAEAILALTYTDLYYLYEDSGRPSVVQYPSETTLYGKPPSTTSNLLAVFTTFDECQSTYPELFI